MWQKFANLRTLYGFMFGHPGKKLLFMGGEFGQWKEWNFAASLDWHLLEHTIHRQLQQYVKDLNNLYASESILYDHDFDHMGFEWIDFNDSDNSVVSFLRKPVGYEAPPLVFICNFTPVVRQDYRIGVPFPGVYHELLNSDAAEYGGSNVRSQDGKYYADEIPWQSQQCSLKLSIPPLGTVILKPEASHYDKKETETGTKEDEAESRA
jgi:1,4-alpha-glucan branching enzyme